MRNTGFRDHKGNPLYEGHAVEYWDDEGGSGVAIIVMCKHKDKMFNGKWRMVNPAESPNSFAMLESFAPNSVRYLGGKP